MLLLLQILYLYYKAQKTPKRSVFEKFAASFFVADSCRLATHTRTHIYANKLNIFIFTFIFVLLYLVVFSYFLFHLLRLHLVTRCAKYFALCLYVVMSDFVEHIFKLSVCAE